MRTTFQILLAAALPLVWSGGSVEAQSSRDNWVATQHLLERKTCEGCALAGAALKDAKLGGAKVARTDFTQADLSGADLSAADLRGANLTKATLTRANLKGADLSGAVLTRANLSGADLQNANLSSANLQNANLSGANLSGAKPERADLSGAMLTKANLGGATCERTNFDGTNLREADLSGAKLASADLLPSTACDGALYDLATELPRSFVPKDRALVVGTLVVRGHKDDAYNQVYSTDGTKLNEMPVYKSRNGHYIFYYGPVQFTKSKKVWVMQHVPPAPAWTANAYGDGVDPITATGWRTGISVALGKK